MSFVAVAGLGISAVSAYGAYDNAKDAQSAQNRALANARTSLGGFSGGFNVSGLGPSARMSPEGAGFTLDYDADSQRLAQGSGAYASNMFGQLGQGINPMSLGLSGPMGLDQLMMRSAGGGDMAYTDMLRQMQSGFQRPLQNSAFMGAADQLREAQMGGDQARMRTLDLLRSQAQPFESRAMDDLQNRMFSMGQMGSSAGGLQMESFARGLGQADIGRQLAAADEGRAFQNNAMGLAGGMAGMGQSLRGMEGQLLQDAFGRFSTMQGMNADLNQARFSRSMFSPFQIDAARFGNINSALGMRSGLQEQALQMFQAGLGASQAGANTRMGAASNQAAIVGSPSFGMQGAMANNMLSQFGGAMMGGQSAGDILGRVFQPGQSSVQMPTGMLNHGIQQGIGNTMFNNEQALMAFRPMGY